MKKWVVIFIVLFLWHLSSASEEAFSGATYVGNKACNCHKPEFEEWRRSKHGMAFESLKPGKREAEKIKAKLDPKKDYTEDEKCVGCHVTGFKEEGGYKDLKFSGSLKGVGCESCHGPGSEYSTLHREAGLFFTREEAIEAGAVYGSLDEKVCRKCHGHKDSPYQPEVDEKYRFDIKKALEKVETFHKYYEQVVEH